MNTKLLIIFAFSWLYVIFEGQMSMRRKSNTKVEKRNDKGSIWILTASIFLGYALSFSIAATKLGRIYHWNLLFTVGCVLIILGLYLRITAIRTLKQHFTYTVTQIRDHELVTTGLYKKIRHPGYLGQLIIFLGIAITLSNWLSVISMMIPVVAGFMYRIRTEEKFMEEQMGSPYLEYKIRTSRLIPGIF